ncbi:hypothetical protein V6N13_081090 [Hibiscus sabdariffa]
MVILQETKLDCIFERCEYYELHSNLVVKVGRWVVEDWFSGVIGHYASCALDEHMVFWKVVLLIISQRKIAWWVRGDFNMVMRTDEPKFCEFVETVAISNVPLKDNLFTWFGSGNKCSHLDRFFVSNEWFQRFNSLAVINLPREPSAHSLIILSSDTCDNGRNHFDFSMCDCSTPNMYMKWNVLGNDCCRRMLVTR